MARRYKADRLPTWRKLVDNPSYNAFWRGQAVQDMLAAKPLKVPVLVVHGLFDQEDNFGGIAAYRALEAKDTANDMVHLAVGPWNHGQSQNEGSSLGALRWGADTSLWFREKVLQPFWDQHLKGVTPAQPTPPVLAFDTGAHEWHTYQSWPADGQVDAGEAASAAGRRPRVRSRPPADGAPSTRSTSPIPPSRSRIACVRCWRCTTRSRRGGSGWSTISVRSPIAPTC